MADPICRWRNPYLKTVREFINALPKTVMPSIQAREIVRTLKGDDFYTTAYQLACQLGLYYEDDTNYYPRFTYEPTLEEVLLYLRNWLMNYYVPNPYTRGFIGLDSVIVHSELCKLLIQAKSNLNWNTSKSLVFKEIIGNDDILKNTINCYSDVITIDKSGLLTLKDGVEFGDLEPYIMCLGAKDRKSKAAFFAQFSITANEDNSPMPSEWRHNLIMYGAPGTGKSFELEKRALELKGQRQRVTFYPDYSYSKFVGNYKPVTYYRKASDETEFYGTKTINSPKLSITNEPVIDYCFAPGPFLQALCEAFISDQPYLLLIEEINRANAAAIFGEVFQLLDRTNGVSNYKVMLSVEAMLYIQDRLGDKYEPLKDGIYLPSNLYIWATMNSADQGVFHLDSAFKRRWSFEYLPLDENEGKCKDDPIFFCGKNYNWNLFRNTINQYLSKVCKISEDRLIGPFFLNRQELTDSASVKNKLLLYLRDDVLRHNHRKLFLVDTFSEIILLFNNGTDVFVETVMDQLNFTEDVSC